MAQKIGSSVDLADRATTLVELMDDPRCDPAVLDRTYRRFTVVNALVSGWRSTFRDEVLPALPTDRRARVLDLGCGGGDLARSIARWARSAGRTIDVIGVDPDHRAIRAATRVDSPGVTFRTASSRDLVDAHEQFDAVVSNHVLHHLSDDDRERFLAESAALVGEHGRVVHSDIRRSPSAYRSYAGASWLVSAGTFVRVDGLRSIRRSYTVDELRSVVPVGWDVRPRAPHRLVAVWDARR
jgi:ubiquinone/menaquinone biosynthesis C-methylase UbiE